MLITLTETHTAPRHRCGRLRQNHDARAQPRRREHLLLGHASAQKVGQPTEVHTHTHTHTYIHTHTHTHTHVDIVGVVFVVCDVHYSDEGA